MNTKGTPAYKRVARAEASRDEWKMKAIERREEAEKWKTETKRKTERIEELLSQKDQLEHELTLALKNIKDLKPPQKKHP